MTALFGLTAYCYMINKGLGFLSLFVIMLAVEMFIEVSGMISDKYHPVLSIARRVRKKMSRAKTYDELLESLELYYRVFYLGEELEE